MNHSGWASHTPSSAAWWQGASSCEGRTYCRRSVVYAIAGCWLPVRGWSNYAELGCLSPMSWGYFPVTRPVKKMISNIQYLWMLVLGMFSFFIVSQNLISWVYWQIFKWSQTSWPCMFSPPADLLQSGNSGPQDKKSAGRSPLSRFLTPLATAAMWPWITLIYFDAKNISKCGLMHLTPYNK